MGSEGAMGSSPRDDILTTTPFLGLRKMLRARRRELLRRRQEERRLEESGPASPSQEDDLALFLEAMKDVVPLEGREAPVCGPPPAMDIGKREKEEDQRALERLEALVSGALPIPVRDTPEFVEGSHPAVSPWLCKRLHAGHYSVQGYLDLHGLDALSALDACFDFFEESMELGRRCIAVIHGRGLSSKGDPVLKGVVLRWIRKGPFRRYVLAYSSAPQWDGGAGVTYILLARRPMPKLKKRRKGRRGC